MEKDGSGIGVRLGTLNGRMCVWLLSWEPKPVQQPQKDWCATVCMAGNHFRVLSVARRGSGMLEI